MQSLRVDVLVFAANLPPSREVGDARVPILSWVVAKTLFASEICGKEPQNDKQRGQNQAEGEERKEPRQCSQHGDGRIELSVQGKKASLIQKELCRLLKRGLQRLWTYLSWISPHQED
jgi:hypothetical protein